MKTQKEKECISIILSDDSTISFDNYGEDNKDYTSEYTILEKDRFTKDLIKFLKAT